MPEEWQYKHFKPLVAIPSPRNIKAFEDAVDDELEEYDVVWFKYFPQWADPYAKIKSFFLSHKKYTHLIILPDDLIVTREGVGKIVDLILKNPDRYRVIMGNCRTEFNAPYMAMTKNLPDLDRKTRVYEWYTWQEVHKFNNMPVKVKHAGTPFAVLRRDVVEQVSLDNDYYWNQDTGSAGTSEDVVLSHDLHRLKIPIYVHTGVEFTHLRGTPEAFLTNTERMAAKMVRKN